MKTHYKQKMLNHKGNFKDVWQVPIGLSILTIIGLLSALLETGIWRVLSWLVLSVVLAVIVWFVVKPLLQQEKIKEKR